MRILRHNISRETRQARLGRNIQWWVVLLPYLIVLLLNLSLRSETNMRISRLKNAEHHSSDGFLGRYEERQYYNTRSHCRATFFSRIRQSCDTLRFGLWCARRWQNDRITCILFSLLANSASYRACVQPDRD